jgi:hypothetical protein
MKNNRTTWQERWAVTQKNELKRAGRGSVVISRDELIVHLNRSTLFDLPI